MISITEKTTFKILLDNQTYQSKPTEFNKISNRIVKCSTEIDIVNFSKQITTPNGRTWIPAYLENSRKNENWKHQQIFALDFDKGIAFNQVVERLKEYGLDCTFAYETFSCTNELPKFRIIWNLNQVIIDREYRDKIQLCLMWLFPEADQACKDPSRMFFGGKELIYTNYDYFLDLPLLMESSLLYETKNSSEKNIVKKIKCSEKRLNLEEIWVKPNNILGTNHISSKNDPSLTVPSSSLDILGGQNLLDNVDFNKLSEKIRLLADFMNPAIKLLHPQLFGLATNLRYIRGGEKLFKQCLQANASYGEDKKAIMPYIKHKSYLPMSLKNFSLYEEDHEYENLLTAARLPRGEVVRVEPYQSISLDKAETMLDNAIQEALADTTNSIWIIKKATGLGGTEKLLKLEGAIVALPNHGLKNEISKRFKVNHLTTPELPLTCTNVGLKKRIEYLYSIGAIRSVHKLIKEESLKNIALSDYLRETRKAFASNQTVITTHQKALFVDFHKHSTVVFDEDPLSSVLEIGDVTIDDLNRLVHSTVDPIDKVNLKKYVSIIIDGLFNCVESTKEVSFNDIEAIENAVLESNDYNSNILKFLKSDYYSLDSQNTSKLYFLKHNSLNSEILANKKVIILSGTANEHIYRKLYGDRVKFVDISNVEMKEIIIQDTSYSLSRSSFRNESVQNKVKNKVGDKPVITFSSYKGLFSNAVEELHYGKCTGFDNLKGQDIAVVGTPHLKSVHYLLVAKALRIKLAPQDFRLETMRVKHNGCEFRITTFIKPELRLIQFHFIEDQIRQAVGRARLLRMRAMVLLLSGFPLPEAAISENEKALALEKLQLAKTRDQLEGSYFGFTQTT